MPLIDLDAHNREVSGDMPMTVTACKPPPPEVVTVDGPDPDDVPNLAKAELANLPPSISAVENRKAANWMKRRFMPHADNLQTSWHQRWRG